MFDDAPRLTTDVRHPICVHDPTGEVATAIDSYANASGVSRAKAVAELVIRGYKHSRDDRRGRGEFRPPPVLRSLF